MTEEIITECLYVIQRQNSSNTKCEKCGLLLHPTLLEKWKGIKDDPHIEKIENEYDDNWYCSKCKEFEYGIPSKEINFQDYNMGKDYKTTKS